MMVNNTLIDGRTPDEERDEEAQIDSNFSLQATCNFFFGTYSDHGNTDDFMMSVIERLVVVVVVVEGISFRDTDTNT